MNRSLLDEQGNRYAQLIVGNCTDNSKAMGLNTMTLDFKPLMQNLPVGAPTESWQSTSNGYRLSLQDSARSRNSVVLEIEKLTKFTEADIRASILEAQDPRKSPHQLNLSFRGQRENGAPSAVKEKGLQSKVTAG